MELGKVESLFLGPEEGGPVREVESLVAVAGRGLQGDRYFHTGDGPHDPTLEITLVEIEPLERAPEEHDLVVEPIDMRRNVVTRGVTLRDLIGRKFSVGEVVIEALQDNPPCRRLQRLTGKPLLKPLIENGGVRGRIVQGGTIRPGDPISVED
jgi:MOSC domain-containing protein YiiM